MIDVKYYTQKILGVATTTWLNYFSTRTYSSLSHFIVDMKNIDLSWINTKSEIEKIRALCNTLVVSLESEQLTFQEVINEIESRGVDILSHIEFSELEISDGKYSGGCCPSCGKKELFIPKHGSSLVLICNRKNACGYTSSAYTYLKQYKRKTSQEALDILAQCAGTSLEEINYLNEVHTDTIAFKKNVNILSQKNRELQKNDYELFDEKKENRVVEYEQYLPNHQIYSKLDEVQKFKVFATTIYNFSLSTIQWGKQNYYKSIGIYSNFDLLKEKIVLIENILGYLHFSDLQPLKEHLLKCGFTYEDLVKYGLFVDDSFYISVEEGIVVIPNFDLYTNMVTGLKFRKTKLKTWTDKDGVLQKDKNKEPEFSYKRIANPLPYLLTRDALLNKAIRFRFFEGQKDLHSMPMKPLCCDIAIPGTSGISEESLGLFKGRIVELWFDQDEAGQEGAFILKQKLEKAGAIVINKIWNIEYGKDINEVLINRRIHNLIK